MGNFNVWLLACVIYGLISAGIYAWICRSKNQSRIQMRFVVSFVAYTAAATLICLITRIFCNVW